MSQAFLKEQDDSVLATSYRTGPKASIPTT